LGGRVSLALVIHNHQPVGNFGWVIEDVYEHAYSPMLYALERHPGIRLGLHYTGPLLQWMAANRPAALDQIQGLVDRGQIEIVGGGYYEPILVTLPDRDRLGQAVRMREELEKLFGQRPRGAWLAERVWEPSLAYDLAAAGYDWTVLDDNHLRAASIREDEMWTAFTTDDRGKRLTVFGTEQGLRYRIPFKPVDDLISYLAARRTDDGRFVGMMGDDGEKFGSWPGTFEYCWSREHWVDRCFGAIEAAGDWLSTVTPSQWLDSRPPTKRVYFPTNSYVEMTEWVLPPNETPVFVSLLEDARARDLPAARFLRGGFWRNYMARYREINDLHKQMLRVSEKVDAMKPGSARERALDHLYQGQSNDCYWHGLFGGIYIVHMRMATLAQLIAAEDLADSAAAAGGAGPAGAAAYGARLVDTDLDSIDEVLVTSRGQTVVVDLNEGAAISSWDLRASRVAVASVLRRRPEAYHARLMAHEQVAADAATATATATGESVAGGPAAAAAADGPPSIHDIVTVKEPGLAAFLHYDRHERRSGLVHLLAAGGSADAAAFVRAAYDDLGDFTEGIFEAAVVAADRVVTRRRGSVDVDADFHPLVVEKTYRFGGDRSSPSLELEVAIENPAEPGAAPIAFELALEWNVNMLGGGHNPAAYYETPAGERSPHDVAGEIASAPSIAFGNDYEGVRIVARPEPAARLTWYPVETVSNSEGGFERVYQGSALLFRWPVSLAPGETRTFEVRFAVTQSIDHSAAEAAQ
jgi:4-alpha-glucanotransferase